MTWKGELYFVDEPTADPAELAGSLVAFTKNGQLQGVAYRWVPQPRLTVHAAANRALAAACESQLAFNALVHFPERSSCLLCIQLLVMRYAPLSFETAAISEQALCPGITKLLGSLKVSRLALAAHYTADGTEHVMPCIDLGHVTLQEHQRRHLLPSCFTVHRPHQAEGRRNSDIQLWYNLPAAAYLQTFSFLTSHCKHACSGECQHAFSY